jgi:hypothetical protein
MLFSLAADSQKILDLATLFILHKILGSQKAINPSAVILSSINWIFHSHYG